MIGREHKLPIVRQCELLGVARSSAYYEAQPCSKDDDRLMRRINAIHLEQPFLGSRRVVDALADEASPSTASTYNV